MKLKVLFLTIALLAVTLAGCTNTQKENKEMNTQLALANTYYKLTQDKKLDMLFIGGSVTEGNGASSKATSFPSVIGDKLRSNYPEAEINVHNLAIGGTTSEFAVYRYMYEMAPKKPDILFIEYCINDYYTGYSYDRVVQTSESIVRIAQRENPYIDIVYVFTFDETVADTDYTQLTAHRAVAGYYGFPYVKLSESFYPMLSVTGTQFEEYFKDNVHANDKGYAFFAKTICETLDKELALAAGQKETKYTERILPEKTLAPSLLMYADMVTSDSILLTSQENSGWEHRNANYSWVGTRYNGIIVPEKVGSKFSYEFYGSEVGIAYAKGPDMGKLLCSVDDGEPVLVNAYLSYGNPKIAIIGTNLESGYHTLTVELAEKDERSNGNNAQIAGLLIS